MTSTILSRVAAGVLLVVGVALLFAADALLPLLVPGYPPEGAWLGQLLGAAWLGLASLNWLSRSALLGGIYGRPVVAANVGAFFIGALVLVKVVSRGGAPAVLWAVTVVHVVLAAIYGWLMLRGPVESDYREHRAADAPTGEAP